MKPLARLLRRQPAHLDVGDPHPVRDLVRVHAVDRVRAHRQQEQPACGGRQGYLDSASEVVKRSHPAKCRKSREPN
jgi:hypothetical protein